jgi:hypothetical protein
MTRKDYQLIARALKAYADADALTRQKFKQEGRDVTLADEFMHYRLKGIADSLAYALQQDNPNFKRATFLKMCGLL